MGEGEQRPAAWYPDPTAVHEMRYWDGDAWTEHVSDAGVTGTAALTVAAAPPVPMPAATLASSASQAVIQSVGYLGGLSGQTEPLGGILFVTRYLIGLGWLTRPEGYAEQVVVFAVRMNAEDVASVEVTSETVAKSRLWPVLAFGVLGLAAKGSANRTYVAVHLKAGEVAYFVINDVSETQVRALLTPVLKSGNVPFRDETAPTNGQVVVSVADELTKLAHLRDTGVLTPEEFEAQKRKLLAL